MVPRLRHGLLKFTQTCTHRTLRLHGARAFASGETSTPIGAPDGNQEDHLSIPPETSSTASSSRILDGFVPSPLAIEAYSKGAGAKEKLPLLDIPLQSDPLLEYFTNTIMQHGKKHEATRRTSRMLLFLNAWTGSAPLPIFREAVATASPSIRVLMHKTRAGKGVFKPIPLGERQRTRFAFKWILQACQYPGPSLEEKVAKEILAILKGTAENNGVLKKKAEMHTLGMVNRMAVKTF